ncbi:hypothetical protein [Chitinophaga sp. MM2321]|uniref:hypothetical protein n=1 Tax=Chitinophaga sp. MM2321 TaxID=3137178 RepID=UPI0032D56A02
MNYEIIELQQFSGKRAHIYSIIMANEDISLFERFVRTHISTYKTELNAITKLLTAMGCSVGVQEKYFKVQEGIPAAGVSALYGHIEKNLRLYCIRYGAVPIIIGGGGSAAAQPPSLQKGEKPEEVIAMMKISKDILHKIHDGAIYRSPDGSQLKGDLIFKDHDKE